MGVAHNQAHHGQQRDRPAHLGPQQNKHRRDIGVKPKHAQFIGGHKHERRRAFPQHDQQIHPGDRLKVLGRIAQP